MLVIYRRHNVPHTSKYDVVMSLIRRVFGQKSIKSRYTVTSRSDIVLVISGGQDEKHDLPRND